MMNNAFQCRIIAYVALLSKEEVKKRGGNGSLEELLARSNVVSLHMNETGDNKGMFNADFFTKMRESAILINCARDSPIDAKDLAEVLENGQFGGYAVDVPEKEPPGEDHPLLKSDQIIITPHTGAYNRECTAMIRESVVSTIKQVPADRESADRSLQ